jgi:cellulose synthase/poly-beta-1,6-N-acetylglucosamine synthase-like glycosyltransferase
MAATLLTYLFGTLCVLAALPVAVLCAQVALAHAVPRRSATPSVRTDRGNVAVLIPAHDEALGIGHTLRSVQAQLRAGDRLLVVADNCSDNTAEVARAAGAEVVERSDSHRRGKGYALDHGVRQLAAHAPAMVLVVDADCLLDAGALQTLAQLCQASGRPVQALYEMAPAPDAGLRARVSAFAWRVRNRVRPRGWWVVGAPCQLMGTGMMFPWPLLSAAPLASGHIAEDVELGVGLALRGHPPLFAPQARVSSTFPTSDGAATAQRRRWEHGNLALMLVHGPRLLVAGLRRSDARLVALAADLMVPPLALLVQMQTALALLAALTWAMFGASAWPWAVSAAALSALTLAILAAWRLAGRDTVTLSELLLTAPAYALRKLPMYLAFLVRRQSTWVRAKREGE